MDRVGGTCISECYCVCFDQSVAGWLLMMLCVLHTKRTAPKRGWEPTGEDLTADDWMVTTEELRPPARTDGFGKGGEKSVATAYLYGCASLDCGFCDCVRHWLLHAGNQDYKKPEGKGLED